MKKLYIINLIALFLYGGSIRGETITIINPADGSTVNGLNLEINGTASLPDALINISINDVLVAQLNSDSEGDWSYVYPQLEDGPYTVTADLFDSSFSIVATDSHDFTVENPDSISITNPTESSKIATLLPSLISGLSSLPNGQVRVTVDSIEFDTVATDSFGNWESIFPTLKNTEHTILAELLSGVDVVASDTRIFTSLNHLTLPTDITHREVLHGNIPTTGTGSGAGFTYSVTGSTITITFNPAFTATPFIVASGQQAGGSSTVTIDSVSTTASDITFSAGTDSVHFQATSILTDIIDA